jgi:hypothetical protein
MVMEIQMVSKCVWIRPNKHAKRTEPDSPSAIRRGAKKYILRGGYLSVQHWVLYESIDVLIRSHAPEYSNVAMRTRARLNQNSRVSIVSGTRLEGFSLRFVDGFETMSVIG